MSVKLTAFGQFTRKLRVDSGEYLKDMAKRLDVTASYLSAVECGRRNAPYEWVDRLTQEYALSDRDSETLREAVSDSRTYDKLDIAHLSFDDKRLIHDIVKQMASLDSNKRDELQGLFQTNSR